MRTYRKKLEVIIRNQSRQINCLLYLHCFVIHFYAAKTPDSKSDEDVKIKEKENTTPEKTTSTVKPEDNAAGEGSRRRRIKKKKMITKTFEDEDGYISINQ